MSYAKSPWSVFHPQASVDFTPRQIRRANNSSKVGLRNLRQANSQGFTVVELLIVIVVIGILVAIAIVAYNGIQERARNTARISAARSNMSLLRVSAILDGLNVPPGAINRYCLTDSNPDVTGDGISDCGEVGSSGYKSGSVSQQFIEDLKKSGDPSQGPPVESWSPKIYVGPTLEVAGSYVWQDANGNPINSVLHYWLEGANRDCVLPAVQFDYSASPVPEGATGARAVIRDSTTGYSYADSRATYCYSVVH